MISPEHTFSFGVITKRHNFARFTLLLEAVYLLSILQNIHLYKVSDNLDINNLKIQQIRSEVTNC